MLKGDYEIFGTDKEDIDDISNNTMKIKLKDMPSYAKFSTRYAKFSTTKFLDHFIKSSNVY